MDAKLTEQQDRWRGSAEAFRKQVTQQRDCATSRTDEDFLTLAHDCRRAGLLSWSLGQSPCPDLKSTAAVIEELSLSDAALGILAINEYLYSRVVDHIADPRIRSRIQQHLSAFESILGVRWLSPAPDVQNQALTFFAGAVEPAFAGIGLFRPGKNPESTLLFADSSIAAADTTKVALTGLEA